MMNYEIKENADREIEGKGSGIITVKLVEPGSSGSFNSLGGLPFLDQLIFTFCNFSRSNIFQITLVILLVSQANINLTFDSIWIDLSLFFLSCVMRILVSN